MTIFNVDRTEPGSYFSFLTQLPTKCAKELSKLLALVMHASRKLSYLQAVMQQVCIERISL